MNHRFGLAGRFNMYAGAGLIRFELDPPEASNSSYTTPASVALRYVKFVVDAARDPGLAGAEVLEFNGVPFRAFIAPALERVPGETAPYREYLFCRDQADWWNLSGLLSGLQGFELRLKARCADNRLGVPQAGLAAGAGSS